MTIDLASLKSNYIDLKGLSSVVLTGKYLGDRIVLRNASNVSVVLDKLSLETTHKEDALIVEGETNNLKITGLDAKLIGGGLTFWGAPTNLILDGLNILFPHTGIRYTGTAASHRVTIKNCNITGASHEGVYWGASYAGARHSSFLFTKNVIKESGWDGGQFGNVEGQVIDNVIKGYGLSEVLWQDKGININPNCLITLKGNKIKGGTGQKICVLDSRCFIE